MPRLSSFCAFWGILAQILSQCDDLTRLRPLWAAVGFLCASGCVLRGFLFLCHTCCRLPMICSLR